MGVPGLVYNTAAYKRKLQEDLSPDFLRKKVSEEGLTITEIQKLTGYGRSSIQRRILELGLRRRKKTEDLTGKTFGSLFVLGRISEIRCKNTVWRCLCRCGRETEVLGGNLYSGNTGSCGCSRWGPESGRWGGYGEISKTFWSAVENGAKARGYDFDIDIQEGWDLFLKQNRRCVLSGWSLVFRRRVGEETTASLDRKDSSLGYFLDNVQWVHKDVNLAKGPLSDEYFLEICRAVASHHGR